MNHPPLLAGLTTDGVAVHVGGEARVGPSLRAAVAAVAAEVVDRRAERVLVPTRPDLATVLAVLGGLAAGALVVPVDGHGGGASWATRWPTPIPTSSCCRPGPGWPIR